MNRRPSPPGAHGRVPPRIGNADEAEDHGSPLYATGAMRYGVHGEPHVRRSIRWGGTAPYVIPPRELAGPSVAPLSQLLAYVQDVGRPLTWSVLVSFEFDTDSWFLVDSTHDIVLTAWLNTGVGQANVPMVKQLVVNTVLAPPDALLPPGAFYLPPQLIQWDVVPAENIQVQAKVAMPNAPPGGPWSGKVSGLCAPYFMTSDEG